MSDIFLSYASSDHQKARVLADTFEGRGYSVFWDRNIPAGVDFSEFIGRALEEARAVVVLWSRESVNSEWVREEAAFALSRSVLIPVLIETAKLPLQFSRIQAADLTGWHGEDDHPELEHLLVAVEKQVGARERQGSVSAESPRPRSPRTKSWKGLLEKLLGGGSKAEKKAADPAAPTPRRKYDIFLSYRRSDSAYATGHISEYLRERFGQERIFKDVDTIQLAADYRRVVEDAVADCQIMVAVIGGRWIGQNEDGSRRIDEDRDLVRIELETALKRSVPLVPVLVEGAKIPSEQSLPESLKQLPYRNGAVVRPDPDFRGDVERLLDGLEQLLKPA